MAQHVIRRLVDTDDDDDSQEPLLEPHEWPKNVATDERGIQRGNMTSLVAALGRPMDASALGQLTPCARDSYNELCTTASLKARPGGLAVLVSGHPRTMVEPDVVAAYTQLMQMARETQGEVHVFASLAHGPGKDKLHSSAVDIGLLRRVLQQWRVNFTLQAAADEKVRPMSHRRSVDNASVSCGQRVCWPDVLGAKASNQRTKIALTINMMRAAERARGAPFEMVLRLRPDLCIRPSFRTLAEVLVHTSRCSPLIATWHDSVAIVPRWAVESFGSVWREVACGRVYVGMASWRDMTPCVGGGSFGRACRAADIENSKSWSLGGIHNYAGWALVQRPLALLGHRGVELLDFGCMLPLGEVPAARRITLNALIKEFDPHRMTCPEGRVGIRRQRGVRSAFGERVTPGTQCGFLN